MRIAIVSEMVGAVETLRRVVIRKPDDRLAWIARDGAEAVERCKHDTPDLILMELMLPVMDATEATRRIMNETPCPILILTSTMEAHSAKVFQALGEGAMDAVETPMPGGSEETGGFAALRFKIDQVNRRGSQKDNGAGGNARNEAPSVCEVGDCLIAIGASAGGPAALAVILNALPREFPAAIVIVQHLDAEFVPSMATWLNETSRIPVNVARQGDKPQARVALIAETNHHLLLTNSHSLGYTPEPRDSFYHPSIDVFFQSVVRHWKGKAAGVLLTGMGRDGARGLLAMRDFGSLTIAQDAASSVVYGMPKAAAELNAAAKILPLNEIAGGLINFVALHARKRIDQQAV